MRNKLYHLLVNQQMGIRERYHRMHDGTTGISRIISWVYLLWLNVCYYLFFCRFLGRTESAAAYEEKRLLYQQSESQAACMRCQNNLLGKSGRSLRKCTSALCDLAGSYVNYLQQYDVISFDLFDTLLFRPFSAPDDLFFLLGEKLDFLDFRHIRIEMEAKARREKFHTEGNYEVTLAEIWNQLERETGMDAVEGGRLECRTEEALCYANPFMQKIFAELRKRDKMIVVTTDMYLPPVCLERMLVRNGLEGVDGIYISSVYGKAKWDGSLFDVMRADFRKQFHKDVRMIHIGDSLHSDVKMARKHGIDVLHYPNADIAGSIYRVRDISPIIGGAYRGIVDHHLYSGLSAYSMEYEYGFVYGGLFVVGYCAFIHKYVRDNDIDKILFFSRDGDILRQVYTLLYPKEETSYVYWSRAAALKLTADENRYDFFRRFLFHKVNQGRSIAEVFREMELESLSERLPVNGADLLTNENVGAVKELLLAYWREVLMQYDEQCEAARKYFEQVLSGCCKAAAVDIGWAGSGAVALRILLKRWQIPCELIGILAGTNSVNNAEPDASEAQLQSGKLVSYLFSQSFNRDVLKKHDPALDDNVYWELLLSSPTRQFVGFYPSEEGIMLRFGKMPANSEGCREIQRGILDFAREYQEHFKDYPYMFSISGRDACAPMLAACGHNRKYLKMMAARFAFDVSVSCSGDCYMVQSGRPLRDP